MNQKDFLNKNIEEDTIAAISTPLGIGGIGIVRMSGPLSIQIASKIFRHKGKSKKKPEEFKSHHIYYGTVAYSDKSKTLDEVMLTVMRKPRTYTKENDKQKRRLLFCGVH